MSRLWRVSDVGVPLEGNRIHTRIDGRYVTVFRNKGKLSCIDSICHHAGGPLTLGHLQEIEDLSLTVVSCPWHRYLVSISDGTKVYQEVKIINGKPTNTGWVNNHKCVQRSHNVIENDKGIFIELMEINENDKIASDNDTCNERCAQDYNLHHVKPTLQS